MHRMCSSSIPPLAEQVLGCIQGDFRSLAEQPRADLFLCTTSLQHENIVIQEEVTSTFGESQSFPVSKAASGIEHTQPGGNLEGWTSGLLKASRAVTRGLRPKMFHDTRTVKFHRGQRWISWERLAWISRELSFHWPVSS